MNSYEMRAMSCEMLATRDSIFNIPCSIFINPLRFPAGLLQNHSYSFNGNFRRIELTPEFDFEFFAGGGGRMNVSFGWGL